MNTPRRILLLVITCFGILLSASCKPHSSNAQTNVLPLTQPNVPFMPPIVSIKVGELGPNFAKRYPGLIKSYESLPGVVQDYDINWEQKSPGSVRIEHGQYSFTIAYVLGIQSAQDLKEYAPEGLSEFSIFAGVTNPDLIDHDEARIKTYAILKRILDVGWKPILERSDPRLFARDRFQYAINLDDSIGLDPRYIPTFDEWMHIKSLTSWSFYANGLFMEVNFTREPTLTDPTKPGSYLLSFNIKTAVEYYRGYAGPENRARWKELLPAALAQAASERARRETELHEKGIQIDTSYQDPPLPNLE